MDSLEKMKEKLKNLTDDLKKEDRDKLEDANNMEQLAKVVTELNTQYTNKFNDEMLKDALDGKNNEDLKELANLRRDTVDCLQDQDLQKLTNERLLKSQEEQLDTSGNLTQQMQKDALTNDNLKNPVKGLMDKLSQEEDSLMKIYNSQNKLELTPEESKGEEEEEEEEEQKQDEQMLKRKQDQEQKEKTDQDQEKKQKKDQDQSQQQMTDGDDETDKVTFGMDSLQQGNSILDNSALKTFGQAFGSSTSLNDDSTQQKGLGDDSTQQKGLSSDGDSTQQKSPDKDSTQGLDQGQELSPDDATQQSGLDSPFSMTLKPPTPMDS